MDDTKSGSGKSRKKIKNLDDAIAAIEMLQDQVVSLMATNQELNARLAKCEVQRPVNVTREKLVDLIMESVRPDNDASIAQNVRAIFNSELRGVIRGSQDAHAILADMARQHMATIRVAPEQIEGIRRFVDEAVALNLESGMITFRRQPQQSAHRS